MEQKEQMEQIVTITKSELFFLYIHFYNGDKNFDEYCKGFENKRIKVVESVDLTNKKTMI